MRGVDLRRIIIACVLCLSLVGCSPPPAAESTASVSEASTRTPDGFFESNGARIHYSDTGDGDAVVLIHGFTSNLSRWAELGITERLVQGGFRVIAMDARGHGQSDKPSAASSYGDAMIEDVARLMDYLAVDRIHLVGYSMGGLIANKFRETYPERLRTAVLGGAGWMPDGASGILGLDFSELASSLREGRGMGALIIALTPEGEPEPTAELLEQASQQLAAFNDLVALAAVAEGMKEFGVSESNLRENRVPTLALIGEIDPMRESVDALEAVMANVNIRVIPGAGHMNAFDAPEFTDGLLDFLSANRAN